MAYSNVSVYPASIRALDQQTFLPADTTAIKLLSTAGTNGSWIRCIIGCSNETATNHDAAFYYQISGTNYLIGTVQIPLNSGFTSGVAPTDILRSVNMTPHVFDSCGNKILWLPPSAALYAGMNVTVGTGKQVTLTAYGEDF